MVGTKGNCLSGEGETEPVTQAGGCGVSPLPHREGDQNWASTEHAWRWHQDG